jgi:transposase-like protein
VYTLVVCVRIKSDRLKAMSVFLYVLGLSYGAVEDFLKAFGVSIGKTTVYENVQEAGLVSRPRQQEDVAQGGPRTIIGSDGTYVKVKGQK